MKYTKLTIAAALGLTLSANAATTVSVANFGATGGYAVVDAAGVPIAASGLGWAVGTFPTAFNFAALDNVTDDATVLGSFMQSGSDGGFIFDGYFNSSLTDTDGSANSLLGESIFLVIGNNTDVSAATDVIVVDLAASFPAQDGAGNGSVTGILLDTSALVVFGEEDVVVDQSGASTPFDSATFATGVTFDTVIPEPSTALLSGLAGLALLRRRR